MKKILAISLILTLCFTLFACGDENNTDPTTTTTTQSSTTTTTQNSTTTTTTQSTTTTTTVMEFSTDDYCYTVVDGEATITMAYNAVGDVVIPSTLGGYPVTAIGERAFSGCDGLKSVTIPDGVTDLVFDVFKDCKNLESITIPPSLKNITDSAFFKCDKLKRVDITDLSSWCEINFGYQMNPVSNGANLYLNGVKVDFSGDFVIPEGTERIGQNAFYHMGEITSVTIPFGVTTIGYNAFAYCDNLINITIPPTVEDIYGSAFFSCDNLQKVNISNLDAWNKIRFGGGIQISYHKGPDDYTCNPLYCAELYLNGVKAFGDDPVIPINYYYDGNTMFELSMPKIVGNTETLKELNVTILEDTLSAMEYFYYWHEEYDHLIFDKGVTIDYEYIAKNDVLVVYVYSTVPRGSTITGGSGDGMTHNNYYYDIANDKTLTTSQVVERFGLELPEYHEEFFPNGITAEDLDSDLFYITVSGNELKMEWNGV